MSAFSTQIYLKGDKNMFTLVIKNSGGYEVYRSKNYSETDTIRDALLEIANDLEIGDTIEILDTED